MPFEVMEAVYAVGAALLDKESFLSGFFFLIEQSILRHALFALFYLDKLILRD